MNGLMNASDTIFIKMSESDTWSSTSQVDSPNRAMSFGDGLFETMYWDGEKIRLFDFHLDRLKYGMEILDLSVSGLQEHSLLQLLQSLSLYGESRLRWTVFRSGKGKYTPESSDVVQLLQISDFHRAPAMKHRAIISEKIRLNPSIYSSSKTLNGLSYVLANLERKRNAADEIILLDNHGNVAEAGAANIFWEKGGKIYTPSLESGCIAGVMRRSFLDFLEEKRIEFVQDLFPVDDLLKADRVWVSNATGISMLGQIGSKAFQTDLPDYLFAFYKNSL
ncbi:aminodeoxychorismate lyase [Algoriphagus formosus]|uniref:branched-chain-amino-acid transaminase n=2 Tax=Algoriphagus formosus TaxID=2007308 RepID=A0A4R5V8A8_9BACT|nr:aminodeoxychorismate lyase [Algoriphagus aquimaris]